MSSDDRSQKCCILQKIINTALPPRVVSRHGVRQAKSMVAKKRDRHWHENKAESGGFTIDAIMLKPNI